MWAELSVAFLSDGYIYMKSIDPSNQDASKTKALEYSPPFISPAVLERQRSISPLSSHTQNKGVMSKFKRLLGQREIMFPCSKFYPFTKEQFQAHHSYLYSEMAHLWQTIAEWEGDVEISTAQQKCWGLSMPPPCL